MREDLLSMGNEFQEIIIGLTKPVCENQDYFNKYFVLMCKFFVKNLTDLYNGFFALTEKEPKAQ